MPHLLQLAGVLPPFAPGALALDRVRARHVGTLTDERRVDFSRVERCLDLLAEREDITAATTVDEIARALLGELRDSSADGWAARAGSWIDRAVRTNRGEWMDLEGTPAWAKRLEMDSLDRLNRNMGQYAGWTIEVADVLADAPRARLCDLAAGSGGFYRCIAANPPRGPRLELRSTDMVSSYVELGRERARRDGLDVTFEVRNALQLQDLRGAVDLFTCTQATHHLPPGLVVRMIHAAIHVAPRGIVIVDVMRGAGFMLGAVLATGMTAPHFPVMVFDGVQSVRRGFTPAEFELLARLAGAGHIETHFRKPAHVVLRASA